MRTGSSKDYGQADIEIPTRNEVATVLQGLVDGSRSRQSASTWASVWLLSDARISDSTVWDALQLLGAADLMSFDRPFLYNDEDFLACLGTLCA